MIASCFFVVASSTSGPGGAGTMGSSASDAYPPTLAATAGVRAIWRLAAGHATGRRKVQLDTDAPLGTNRRTDVSWGVGRPTKPRRAAAASGMATSMVLKNRCCRMKFGRVIGEREPCVKPEISCLFSLVSVRRPSVSPRSVLVCTRPGASRRDVHGPPPLAACGRHDARRPASSAWAHHQASGSS